MERQFYSSPREWKLVFLYLANDIIQNSRKKINIWEERKVFSSEQQNIREEFDRMLMDGGKRNGKFAGVKPLPNCFSCFRISFFFEMFFLVFWFVVIRNRKNWLWPREKIVSCYQVVNGGQTNEEANLSKCRGTVGLLEKMEKDVFQSNMGKGSFDEASILEDMQGQHVVLKKCIEQLAAVESARARLVSYLRDVLQEQQFKLDRVRQQLQVGQARLETTANICRNYSNSGNKLLLDRHDNSYDVHNSEAPATSIPIEEVEIEQSAPGTYPLQPPYRKMSVQVNDESRKIGAASMATKLMALTSLSQLSSVLTSLASKGVIGNLVKDSYADYSPVKRPWLDKSHFTFQPVESTSGTLQPPLPPTSAPPIPPPPPPGLPTMPSPPSSMHHFTQDPPGMPAATFTCGMVGHHLPQPIPGGTAPLPTAPPNDSEFPRFRGQSLRPARFSPDGAVATSASRPSFSSICTDRHWKGDLDKQEVNCICNRFIYDKVYGD